MATTAPSNTHIDRLARAYREARVLVLGDRAPKAARGLALHAEFLRVRAALQHEPHDPSAWSATLVERTRRAIIVALRRQAMVVSELWSEHQTPGALEGSAKEADLGLAGELAAAAMELHEEGDPDTAATARIIEFVAHHAQRSAAEASAISWRSSPAGIAAAEQIVEGSALALAPLMSAVAAIPESAAPGSPTASPPDTPTTFARSQARPPGRRPWVAVGAVAATITAVLLAGWLGGVTFPQKDVAEREPAVAPVAAAKPQTTPAAPRTTTARLDADPIGENENRVWRTATNVGHERPPAAAARVPQAAARTPRPRPTPVPRASHARFEALMRDGVALHAKGWFGPAAARFREAASLDPKSATAYLWLGRALMRSERHAEAKRAFERVIEVAPTGPQADEARARLQTSP